MKQNKTRRYTGGGPRPDRTAFKREEAEGTEPGKEGRNVLYARLTTQQKIDKLPPEPGAKKQRDKLLAQL